MKSVDIIGQKFGRLTVLSLHHKTQRYKSNGHRGGYREYYTCCCECGNEVVVSKDSLLYEKSKSCGCYRQELARESFSSHQLTNHKLYNIWVKMKQRCLLGTDQAYKNYGGRGITVCDEWKNDFMAFYNWAMQNGYKEETDRKNNRNVLSIDRIDVNGNYSPDNCRWVSQKQQCNNKRNNFYITIYNRTQTLKEWCEEKNLNYAKISMRIKRGWDLETAFTRE